MKITGLFIITLILFTSCQPSVDKEKVKKEIFASEKAFEKMAADKGVAEAFYYYADENAVIRRQNDTLIFGKENIKSYYVKRNNPNATVNWTPDFIDVSDCGTLGYTYGKYVWKLKKDDGTFEENRGVFHTVWKKQADNSWKYVWD